MRIIRSLVKQIGGELQVGHGNKGQGARFAVLFNTDSKSWRSCSSAEHT